MPSLQCNWQTTVNNFKLNQKHLFTKYSCVKIYPGIEFPSTTLFPWDKLLHFQLVFLISLYPFAYLLRRYFCFVFNAKYVITLVAIIWICYAFLFNEVLIILVLFQIKSTTMSKRGGKLKNQNSTSLTLIF